MLTLNASGKTNSEAINILKESLSEQETELKILIDTPSQAQELQNFLEAEGFTNILPEDDDGTLYLTAARKLQEEAKSEQEEEKTTSQTPPVKTKQAILSEPKSYGIVIAGERNKHEREIMEMLVASLLETTNKPDVLCLMNDAVNLAVYSSPNCDILKKLEAEGVSILISARSADRRGITEALGVGLPVSMSEILDVVGNCEKLLSI